MFQFITNMINVNMTSVCQVSLSCTLLLFAQIFQISSPQCLPTTYLHHALGVCLKFHPCVSLSSSLSPFCSPPLLFFLLLLFCCFYHGTCSVSVVPKATVDYTNAVCTRHPRNSLSLSVSACLSLPLTFSLSFFLK